VHAPVTSHVAGPAYCRPITSRRTASWRMPPPCTECKGTPSRPPIW
jgi:hypothetical protein